MARLTFPTSTDLIARGATTPTKRIDGIGHYALSASALDVTLADGPYTLTLTGRRTGIAAGIDAWRVTATHPAGPGMLVGQALSLPERIVARANRLMSPQGVTLQRDWRTKTHVLRASNRQTVPLTNGDTVAAVAGAGRWLALKGAQVGVRAAIPAPGASPAPSAATPTAGPTVAPQAAETATSTPEFEEAMEIVSEAVAADTGRPKGKPKSKLPPAYTGKIVLDPKVGKKWDAYRASHRAGGADVIAMVGPSGAGKTHAVHALAAREGLEVVKFDASGVVEPGDWFGTIVIESDGSGGTRTRFIPSDLLTAITTPGPRVLLIDEVNRANGRALNALLPVLDGSGSVTNPMSGRREPVNPEVQIVVTANMGSQFLQVEPLDEAVRTRVAAWVEIDHMTEPQEKKLLMDRVPGLSEHSAGNLARLGAAIRRSAQSGAAHQPVSTRQLLAAARHIVAGLHPRDAVESAVLCGYSAEGGPASDRAKVKTHVAGIKWDEPALVAAGVPGVVYTGTDGSCENLYCGHGEAEHGIGDISRNGSLYCETCRQAVVNGQFLHPGAEWCKAYNPAMRPVTGGAQ